MLETRACPSKMFPCSTMSSGPKTLNPRALELISLAPTASGSNSTRPDSARVDRPRSAADRSSRPPSPRTTTCPAAGLTRSGPDGIDFDRALERRGVDRLGHVERPRDRVGNLQADMPPGRGARPPREACARPARRDAVLPAPVAVARRERSDRQRRPVSTRWARRRRTSPRGCVPGGSSRSGHPARSSRRAGAVGSPVTSGAV